MPDASANHGLRYDPAEAVAALSAADPAMAGLIERAGAFTLTGRPMHSPFDTLLESIVSQQLSGRVATVIHGRVLALLPPGPAGHPAAVAALPDETLRAAGLSRAKVAAVKDLAEKTLAGIVPGLDVLTAMTDAEIVDHLVQVRGIGPWTVEMLLIFHLGRPDVLPVHDLGVRKGYQIVYGGDDLPAPRALAAAGERWRPFRSVASWYLWRAVDLQNPR